MANQPLNEQQLQALLRLKRHEQPPPGYFDDLLHAIHRRQREELLRRPAWRIMLDRVGAFFVSLRRDWAYAGAMAAVLVVGIAGIRVALPVAEPKVGAAIAASPSVPASGGMMTVSQQEAALVSQQKAALAVPFDDRVPVRENNPNLREVKTPRSGPPRFIIDAQPASYEQTQIRF